MKHRSNHRGQLQLLAAAVALALGSTSAFGQQESSEQQAEQQSQGISQSEQSQGISQSEQSQSEQDRSETQTAAAGQQQSSDSEQLDQLAEENDDLSTFVEALKAAGMAESLTDGTEYTLFAPTNDAFEQMSGMDTEELMQPENREQLISLLRAHIVADDVDEEMARSLQQAQTIDGGTIDISAGEQEDELTVGDARVVESGIQAGSLRVYAVDEVLSQGTSLAQAESDLGGGQQQSEQSQPGQGESDPFSDSQSSDQPGAQPQSDQPGAGAQGQSDRPGAGAQPGQQPQSPQERETTPR